MLQTLSLTLSALLGEGICFLVLLTPVVLSRSGEYLKNPNNVHETETLTSETNLFKCKKIGLPTPIDYGIHQI